MHKNIKYYCDVCEGSFRNNYSLQRHIDIIHLGKLINCTKCDFKGTSTSKIYRHMKDQHKKVEHKKSFDCDKCEYKSFSKSHFMRHKESVHLKIKHECQKCNQKFSDKSALI